MLRRPFFALLLILVVFTAGLTASQSATPPPPRPQPPAALDPQFRPHRNDERSPFEAKMERDMNKRRNLDRHNSLKKDTDKLLLLANELKKAVDNSSEKTLSMEVIRKTEEVEKLAKQVREKMKSY